MKRLFLLISFFAIGVSANANGKSYEGIVAKALFDTGEIFRRDVSQKLRESGQTELIVTSAVSIVRNEKVSGDRFDSFAGYCQEITTFKAGEIKLSYLCTLDTTMTDHMSILSYRLYNFK